MITKPTAKPDIHKNSENKVSELEAKIVELNKEIITLRTKVFTLRDELHALNNSRVLGKIILLREYIGTSVRRVTSTVRYAPHRVRVIGAPFVPRPIRKKVKHVYHSVKLRSVDNTGPKQTIVIKNEKWDNQKPLVSIVIPYFNAAVTIDETLHSLATQTFQNFEVIVVNDGSTDLMSITKIRQLQKTNKPYIYVEQDNQGVAAARNAGINKARGKYVICLDSDDMLVPTFIEKSTAMLETQLDIDLITSHMDIFGITNEIHKNSSYDPLKLYKDNMVITAAEFRKRAWKASGGYKSGIGYEDWEYWLNLSEHGFWGRLLPEELFLYRTSIQSRYVEDKDVHWSNLKSIRTLHPKYNTKVKHLIAMRRYIKHFVDPATALINLSNPKDFLQSDNEKPNVLISISWMTFGGAETLIYNYCREIKDDFNITFISGLPSKNEWEYKFKEITPNIYHLANMFDEDELKLEFVSNYIKTRHIELLHIVHNNFMFEMLPDLKKRFPELKVAVTIFNDWAEHFQNSIEYKQYIDNFVSDNEKVIQHYQKQIGLNAPVAVVPNGINCYEEFNPELFSRQQQRAELDVVDNELAIFFVGRFSEEKNPDVFLEVAKTLVTNKRLKFFMIGDGPMRGEIEGTIKKSDVNNISYLGYQSEIARYLSAADIFVLPSSIEGFPLSILEAMAMSVAVIASDVGAISQVIDSGKDGIVVKPGSISEISNAITKLADDGNLLMAVKRNARQKVEDKYSNRTLGVNYGKLYKGLVK